MRRLMALVLVLLPAVTLAGCLNTSPPPEVAAFVDRAGPVLGAAEPCAPRLAARATACARHVVATWPGGLDDGARTAALLRLDDARRQAAASGPSCPKAVQTLRRSPVWQGCYSAGRS